MSFVVSCLFTKMCTIHDTTTVESQHNSSIFISAECGGRQRYYNTLYSPTDCTRTGRLSRCVARQRSVMTHHPGLRND